MEHNLPSYFDALKQYQVEELEDEEELFRNFGFYILKENHLNKVKEMLLGKRDED